MNLKSTTKLLLSLLLIAVVKKDAKAQITLLQDYKNNYSPLIGTFQGIQFREGGFSGIYPIPNTNGKEFWIISDRGMNVDAASANTADCRPTYDKMYGFPSYAPKIHKVRIAGDSIQILKTITIKRPNGTTATGIINPTGYGSTAAEVASTDTVLNCSRFNLKIAAKDIWGVDAEGIVVDREGNFWICEEGGPTIWKLDANGVVLKRYTPYANLAGAQAEDVMIDTCFRYRKNNRGFEGLSITPNGKIYAMIQSPLLYPTLAIGEASRVHRIIEIDPKTNTSKMYVYLNDGPVGAGANQIRNRDWKIGDMAAVNDSTFIVIEHAVRGTTDRKNIYSININGATAITSALYGGKTIEALVDSTTLAANGVKAVKKKLFLDLLANGWPAALDKPEALAIINDSTIAVGNDNDYGQTSPLQNGIATATNTLCHVYTYGLKGINKLSNLKNSPAMGAGPSSSATPYVQGFAPDVITNAILTTGDAVGGYTMCGTPDGVGAYDNNDGTFTVLINHEFGNTAGAIRAHGSKGAFVSKWVVNKSTLAVSSGSDLIKKVYLWNPTTNVYKDTTTAFGRFCSADLPPVSAFYNAATGLGTQERIFMNGEESGNEGRGFGHIATGAAAGNTYELPYLGKYSWENAIACPFESNKTIVVGTDDATPGQVYFYIGTKKNTGTDVDKAGLNGGKLYGVKVTGLITESSASVPAAGTAFSLADLGLVQNTTGSALNTASDAQGVTNFLRPEDGAWDPANPSDFYFATTNAFASPSRLWKLHFTDIANPELGGTITAVLDGTEGQKMLDNLTIDNYGNIVLVEDVGNNVHIGKVWQYSIAKDTLIQLATHDVTRFLSGGANYLTQDEEASGILDVQEILGPGMFLAVDQAHYAQPGELVEGGQLLTLFNPYAYNANPQVSITGNNIKIANGDITPNTADNTSFGDIMKGNSLNKTFVVQNTSAGKLIIKSISIAGANSSEFKLINAPTLPLTVNANGTYNIEVQFAPLALGLRNANITVVTNDFDEKTYTFSLAGNAVHNTGVQNVNTLSSSVKVYPNPTGNEATLYFNLDKKENVSIAIYDLQGKLMYNNATQVIEAGEQTINLNTSSLANGIYFIEIKTATAATQIKTVIIH